MRLLLVSILVAGVWSALLSGCGDEEEPAVEVGCRLNSDCALGEVCDAGICVVDEALCEGPDCPCLSDGDCPTGEACDLQTGECFGLECLRDNNCALGEVCSGGLCVTDVDADRDRDGVPDTEDACPDDQNADQADNDSDGRGDVCDDDDDNDAVPDNLDNCPFEANPVQGDADGDGLGNACDEDAPAIDVRGTLDFTARVGADTDDALVFISGRSEPASVDRQGAFVFEDALTEPDTFFIRVEWAGFDPLIREFQAPDGVNTVELPTLVMIPDGDTIEARGTVSLEGSEANGGVLIQARAGGALIDSTSTASDGAFLLALPALDHELSFSREGYQPLEVTVIFNTQGENTGRFTVDGVVLEEAALSLTAILTATLFGEVASDQGPRNDWPNIAFVTLNNEEDQRISPVVNADGGRGQFQFVSVPSGDYTLNISAQGHTAFTGEVSLLSGDNTLSELLGVEVVELAADDDVTARSTVFLQGEGEGGDNSAVLVRVSIENNLVTTTQTDADGAFAFVTSRQNHTLAFSKANFDSLEVTAVWDEVEGRFEIEGEALEDHVFVLNQAIRSDRDFDGVLDLQDNCPRRANPNQENVDGDVLGDVCDDDIDGDGMTNGLDNCPFSHNPMQEDLDGRGRGVACSGGTLTNPFNVTCSVANQHLDTRERSDQLRGSCGGAGAPEVVYSLSLEEGERWSVTSRGTFSQVIYLLDVRNEELFCTNSGAVQFTGDEEVPAGNYLLVVDGLQGAESSGAVDVSIRNLSCGVTLETSEPVNVGSNPGDVIAGDLDNDGVLDLVVANTADDTVSVLMGDGRGGFEGLRTFEVSQEPVSVALGDFNEDGLVDIVVACRLNGQLHTLMGDGDGGIIDGADDVKDVEFGPLTGRPNGLGVADLDHNGSDDIVITFPEPDQNNPFPLWIQRNGDVSNPLSLKAPLGGINGFALGDITNDGLVDVVATSTTNTANLFIEGGIGQLSDALPFEVGGRPSAVALGDLTNDGLLDIVTANQDSNNLSILTGDSVEFFSPQRTLELGGVPLDVAIGDFNGDRLQDLAVTVVINEESEVRVLLNDGQGNFVFDSGEASPVEQAEKMVLGDFDGDGRPDILTLDPSNGTVQVLLTRTPLDFDGQRRIGSLPRPHSIALGDLNGDGLLDIVSTHESSFSVDQNLSIFTARRGGFEAPETFRVGDAPFSLELADVNNDGQLDIIVGSFNQATVGVMLGNGETFSRELLSNTAQKPFSMATADLDEDGFLDILIGHKGDDRPRFSVMLGLGDGTFEEHLVFEIDGFAVDVDIHDIDQDGHLDLLMAGLDSLLIYHGEGGARFGEPARLSLGLLAYAFDVGDLDGDQNLDIVVVNNENNAVVVMGAGGRSSVTGPVFEVGPPPVLEVGLNPDLKLGDLNQDGVLDLITSSGQDERISALFGDGDGGFAEPVFLPASGGINSVAVGDVGGEGHLDIVTANRNSASIGHFPLRFAFTPEAGGRFGDVLLPSCSASEVEGRQDAFGRWELVFDQPAPCRLDRLELVFDEPHNFVSAPTSLTSPTQLTQRLEPRGLASSSDRLSPQAVPTLARFEGQPLEGVWIFETAAPIDSVRMVVNSYPQDPFSAEPSAALCRPSEDQRPNPGQVCRLPQEFAPPREDVNDPADDFLLEDDSDEDVFLLEGPFDGGFVEGQVLNAFVSADPDADISVGLRTLGSLENLVEARQVSPGLWGLSFTVPPQFNARYFAVHVQGEGVNALSYDLRAGLGEAFETGCSDGIDDDQDGLFDCLDTDCATSPVCEGGGCRAAQITRPGQYSFQIQRIANSFDPSCQGVNGSDLLLTIKVDEDSIVCLDTRGSVSDSRDEDLIMAVYEDCNDSQSELACDDDFMGTQAAVELEAEANKTYFVVLDTAQNSFRDLHNLQLNYTVGPCEFDAFEECLEECVALLSCPEVEGSCSPDLFSLADSDCRLVCGLPQNHELISNLTCSDANQLVAAFSNGRCATVSLPVPGETQNVQGSLSVDSPLFDRPTAECGLSGRQDNSFRTFTFTNDQDVDLDIEILGLWAGGDGFIAVYDESFNPSEPTTNCLTGNDDLEGDVSRSRVGLTVDAGQTIVVVVTTFNGTGEFNFGLEVSASL